MKTIHTLVITAALALSAAAPAFAFNPEGQTLAERNLYNFTADARPIAHDRQDLRRATDAMAQAPRAMHDVVSGQYYNERNIQ